MRQPSRALQDYIDDGGCGGGEKDAWWQAFLEAVRQAWHRLLGYTTREEVRLALSSSLAMLGMPPLPPPGRKQRREKRCRRRWSRCQSAAIEFVESGAAFRATEQAANRLRRATAGLDFCSPLSHPPNLDALPLDRIANHRRLTLDTVQTALAAAHRALPTNEETEDVCVIVARAASEAVEDFDAGDDSAVDRLLAAKQGLDEARIWLKTRSSSARAVRAIRDPDRVGRMRRFKGAREHFELSAAAVYKAEIGLVEDAHDAQLHAETALRILREETAKVPVVAPDTTRNDEDPSSQETEDDEPVIVYFSHDDEPSQQSPRESPQRKVEDEKDVFVDRACGHGRDVIVHYYRESDAPLTKRSEDAYTVVAELERALKNRAAPLDDDDEEEDASLVLVEAPTTMDVASDPRYADVAVAISRRLSR